MIKKTSLLALLSKKSKEIIDKHVEEYIDRLTQTARDWRKWVREQLSVKRKNSRKPNLTRNPYMRTGSLRNSLSVRRATIAKRTASHRANQVYIRVPFSWKKLKGYNTNDYGEELNSGSKFSGSSFSGWKDRSIEELNKRIRERL